MKLDLDRWRRLLALEADARDDGPSFIQVQEAQARAARVRDQLDRYKAAGPTGNVSRPFARARAGEEIMPGIGGRNHDDVTRAFEDSVRELEARASETEQEAKRLDARLHECHEIRSTLHRRIEEVRRWAAEQRPPMVLPGDSIELPPVVTVRSAPSGSPEFIGRVA
jgi:uncharacterized small protein (DUF1192 family)